MHNPTHGPLFQPRAIEDYPDLTKKIGHRVGALGYAIVHATLESLTPEDLAQLAARHGLRLMPKEATAHA